MKRSYEAIVKIAKKEKVSYLRGSVRNVLERYYLAAKENKLDRVVRITSDCPCIDPKVIDYVIVCHEKAKADYTSNVIQRTFADGLDVEVFSFDALKSAYREAVNTDEREHVTAYIYRNPKKFKISYVKSMLNWNSVDLRITLDTIEDYTLLCVVYDQLYSKKRYFGGEDIVRLFKKKPWLKLLNEKVLAKKDFNNLDEELQELYKMAEIQELRRASQFIQSNLKS